MRPAVNAGERPPNFFLYPFGLPPRRCEHVRVAMAVPPQSGQGAGRCTFRDLSRVQVARLSSARAASAGSKPLTLRIERLGAVTEFGEGWVLVGRALLVREGWAGPLPVEASRLDVHHYVAARSWPRVVERCALRSWGTTRSPRTSSVARRSFRRSGSLLALNPRAGTARVNRRTCPRVRRRGSLVAFTGMTVPKPAVPNRVSCIVRRDDLDADPDRLVQRGHPRPRAS